VTYPEPLPVVDAHQTSGPFPEEASLAPRRVAAALSLRRHARAPRELPPVRSWADAAGYRIIGTVYWKTEWDGRARPSHWCSRRSAGCNVGRGRARRWMTPPVPGLRRPATRRSPGE